MENIGAVAVFWAGRVQDVQRFVATWCANIQFASHKTSWFVTHTGRSPFFVEVTVRSTQKLWGHDVHSSLMLNHILRIIRSVV